MSRSILYSNPSSSIVLLDIPTSIQEGQQNSSALKSFAAVEEPYPSVEPKGQKRLEALARLSDEERKYHESWQQDISVALDTIHARTTGNWCHERHVLTTEPFQCQSSSQDPSQVPTLLSSTESVDAFSSIGELQGNMVCNLASKGIVVSCRAAGDFLIPPQATFVFAKLTSNTSKLTDILGCLSPSHAGFDLITMDPPWDNRSARRSRSYETMQRRGSDPFDCAVAIVDTMLAVGGLVGVWITNKWSVRARVTAGFHGYHLYEEWIWVKTTIRGEPITQLDGIWRHPYEVFLLFRRSASLEPPGRRIIAAVPDVHSRKPCLKALLEHCLLPKYAALELFARSLTAGWWSWGDEVLKFQHVSSWTTHGSAG